MAYALAFAARYPTDFTGCFLIQNTLSYIVYVVKMRGESVAY